MSSFGIPNLPGYRQSRSQNPHGRRIPVPVQPKEPTYRASSSMNAKVTQPVSQSSQKMGWADTGNDAQNTGMGWEDVNFSPMNSPAAMGWNKQDSPDYGAPGSESSYIDGQRKIIGKAVGPKTPRVHAAGERPHTYYDGSRPDISVCMHDALRFKVFFEEDQEEQERSNGGWENTEPVPSLHIPPKVTVRKFFLSFFLYDQTISIHEMPTRASGIEGSKFLHRSKVFKVDSRGRKVLFSPQDFKVKSKFTVNGFEFTVADADPRTRKWFMETRGEQLGSPIPFPHDDSEPPKFKVDEKTGMLVDQEGRPVSPKNGGLGGFGKDDVRRQLAGKRAPRPDEEPKPIPPLKRDETVLRFYAIRAPSKEDGAGYFKGNDLMEAPFSFHYFVCDDTVEITVTKKEDIGPLLLKRQMLPKNSVQVPFNDHFVTKKGYSGEMIHWKDLRCGATIDVYGRPVLLLSADMQTTHWYAKRGITLKPWHDERFDPKQNKTNSRVPEFNGYGEPTIQDEFALGLALEPKESSGIVGRKGVIPDVPPKDKGVLSCTGEGATLRFIAQRLDKKTGEPLDQEYPGKRDFVINYYLEDDTISVSEPEVRNSGVRGGLFLGRMKYKRHVALPGVTDKQNNSTYHSSPLSRWFKPIDLAPGSDITIEFTKTGMAVHRFYILDCDAFTAAVLDEGGTPTAASAAAAAYLANEREASGVSPRQAGVCGRLAMVLPKLSELLEANSCAPRKDFEKACEGNGLVASLSHERDFRCIVRDGFTSAKTGSRISTENILSEEDISLFVYVFNSKPPTEREGAIVDHGTFLDCLKLKHSDPPILAAHDEWNEKNAGHVPLPPSLIKETKADYGFARPQSVAAETSSTNTAIEKSLFKSLKAQCFKLKGHDEVEPIFLRKKFREMDIGERGLVSKQQLYKVFKNQGFQNVVSREQADILMRKYSPSGQESYRSVGGTRRITGSPVGDTMDYNALCDAIHLVDYAAVINKILKMSEEPQKVEKRSHQVPTHFPKQPTTAETTWNNLSSRTGDSGNGGNSEGGGKSEISEAQLSEAMQYFSGAFARPVRKSNLRKHCLAFDTARKGQLSRKWLQAAIVTAVRECSIDVHRQDSTDVLFDYFLPHADNTVKYEDFLEVVFRRNFAKAKQIRETNLVTHHKHAW
eukprot:CAMPEP_0114339688 /NCGR_PEP_ID=MMETSP0101-20121206/7892_1 /TAXON_ID=38822 ORGANISM="Pteridomonas danica, Strain PT" /NCGR_SAMPLE_ID=MMETSP0101 /ASSEMBLY_ACC=CAM_ASM_000211 /LENGTH=1152 /DNA_ID=CAMNT_0001472731 /DNA_START=35 /DNA_END=3490 /DNA_ORIENTATION=+